ncbi:MAG: 2-oxoacid:acceptor oxidoreductase subunit alpha [Candidatus Peregrinibacteria bacterium]
MSRIAIKIVGAQGQGVNSVGEMCAKGLKRAGYCVFGYRAYMSLIKGGHSSYHLDMSNESVQSTYTKKDIVVSFDHHGIVRNLRDLKGGGILIHQTPQWKFKSAEDIAFVEQNRIRILYLPTEEILKTLRAKPILGNVLITAIVWSLLGRSGEELKELVREQFGHKKDLLELNFACIGEGVKYHAEHASDLTIALPQPEEHWQAQLLLTGSQAMGLGIIHAGCRVFAGYPMTPASPLLTFIADLQNETHMVVKQAEDEITAAQMVVGAMHAGTRAMTATSGGGYDLMTETVSLAGMTETPMVVVLAQRPGPATGLPTWTAQGDLLLAIHSSHGEFPRIVLAAGDAHDAFHLMPRAFNLAEKFQTPVIVLTDKHVAEALFTVPHFDQSSTKLERGNLVTDPKEWQLLTAEERYDPSVPDGVSKRWLPGSDAAPYCAQGDEHTSEGNSSEAPGNAREQMEKRMRKTETIRRELPEPELYVIENGKLIIDNCLQIDVLLVGWGSTKGAVLDALESSKLTAQSSKLRIGYLHYTHLWPMKTARFEELAAAAKQTILIEGNQQGQLGQLLKQTCGKDFTHSILKYDGRPFFSDELADRIAVFLQTSKPVNQ